MTPDEARRCAIAIADTWPHGKLSIERWVEPLERLDVEPARATYRWLRDHAEHAPTVAAFLAKHRELHASTTSRLREPCELCDGTGWEEITTQRQGHPHPTTGVIPCRCTNGQANRDIHRNVLEHNDRELAHYREDHAA